MSKTKKYRKIIVSWRWGHLKSGTSYRDGQLQSATSYSRGQLYGPAP